MHQPQSSNIPNKLWGELAPAYAHRLLTAREFAQLPNDDFYRYELIDGRVIQMPPPQDEHSNVQANLIMLLKLWQKQHKIRGRVRAELGVLLSEKDQPRLVLGSDAAYIAPGRRGERQEAYGAHRAGFRG
jgi:Uma2 family endonuclease